MWSTWSDSSRQHFLYERNALTNLSYKCKWRRTVYSKHRAEWLHTDFQSAPVPRQVCPPFKMAESRGTDPQRFITVSMFSRHVPQPRRIYSPKMAEDCGPDPQPLLNGPTV